MIQLAFATSNRHKFEEAQAILAPEVVLGSLAAGPDMGLCAEPHATLEGNAQEKLAYYRQHNPRNGVFAEDTGLFIEALEGAPGVYSQRYAQRAGSALGNQAYVLAQMNNVKERGALFRTCIALFYKGKTRLFEGQLYGKIATHTKGKHGFGYDALFIPQGYEQTMAELSAEEKNAISHRHKALKRMKASLLIAHTSRLKT